MKTTGKKGLLLGTALVFLFTTSCMDNISTEDHEQQVASIIENNDYRMDSLEKTYIATLDEIDRNLDVIRDKEGVIILGPKSNFDVGVSRKDQILNNITMINTLLDNNREKIAKLEKSLASYKKGKKEMVNSIAQAKERIASQEEEINNLKKLLAESDFQIAELNKKLDEKNQQLSSMEQKNTQLNSDMNRVYFACGTYKELKKSHIVTKEGGVLGIGGVKTLDRNVDIQQFTELNKKENTTLLMKGKKANIITKHPANSYTISPAPEDMVELTIKDPGKFWSNSKYLVVEVN